MRQFCIKLSYKAAFSIHFGLVRDSWCFSERQFMFATLVLLLQFIQVGHEKLHCTINTR